MAAGVELLGAVVGKAPLADGAFGASLVKPFYSDPLSRQRSWNTAACLDYRPDAFVANDGVVLAPSYSQNLTGAKLEAY